MTELQEKSAYPSDSAWEALHNFELKFGECWKNCGGYCCKTNHPSQNFSLMKKNSAGMVFMPQEYEFLKKHTRLQVGFEETHRHHTFTFDKDRGLTLGFDTAVCSLGGICSLPEYRPLICKFYPYYPIVTPEDGSVNNFITGSLIDQYWGDLGIEHPCWLHRTQGPAVKIAVQKSAPALDHPYFIFYMGAAAIFANHITQKCRDNYLSEFKEDPRKFFRGWETMYLMREFIDADALALELKEFHSRVEMRHGAFEI